MSKKRSPNYLFFFILIPRKHITTFGAGNLPVPNFEVAICNPKIIYFFCVFFKHTYIFCHELFNISHNDHSCRAFFHTLIPISFFYLSREMRANSHFDLCKIIFVVVFLVAYILCVKFQICFVDL